MIDDKKEMDYKLEKKGRSTILMTAGQ